MSDITLAIDAMGGDFGPIVTVPAVERALLQFPNLKIFLVGESQVLAEFLSINVKAKFGSRLEIIHAPLTISDNMKPSYALRNSQNTSMRESLKLVAAKKAQACISSGNTGALMVLARSLVSMLPQIQRPALITALPSIHGKKVWLLDIGANIDVKANQLYQFAIMGAILAKINNINNPQIGLLNIGTEAVKGNQSIKECASLLEKSSKLNYIGFVEGNQIFTGIADVIVCDGFVGNVCLKTSEGLAQLFINEIEQKFSKYGEDICATFNKFNPEKYNGASLLGLQGVVIKSHGNAAQEAFFNAIVQAMAQVEQQLPKQINDCLLTISK